MGERISVRKTTKVVHIKIYHSAQGTALKASDPPVPLNNLIQKLINQGTLNRQVTVAYLN